MNPIDEVLSALSSKLQGTLLSIVGCPPDGLNISSARLVKSKSSGTTASAAAALSFKAAAAAKRNHEARLLSIAGVVGTGIGKHQDDPSQATVEILVEKDSAELRGALPSSVDGIPCHVIETGKFVTF